MAQAPMTADDAELIALSEIVGLPILERQGETIARAAGEGMSRQ